MLQFASHLKFRTCEIAIITKNYLAGHIKAQKITFLRPCRYVINTQQITWSVLRKKNKNIFLHKFPRVFVRFFIETNNIINYFLKKILINNIQFSLLKGSTCSCTSSLNFVIAVLVFRIAREILIAEHVGPLNNYGALSPHKSYPLYLIEPPFPARFRYLNLYKNNINIL